MLLLLTSIALAEAPAQKKACPVDAPALEVEPLIGHVVDLPDQSKSLVTGLYTLAWLGAVEGCIEGRGLIVLSAAGNPFGLAVLDQPARRLLMEARALRSVPEKGRRVLEIAFGTPQEMLGNQFEAENVSQVDVDRVVTVTVLASTDKHYRRAVSAAGLEPGGDAVGGVPQPLALWVDGLAIHLNGGRVDRPTRVVADAASGVVKVEVGTGRQTRWVELDL